MANSTDTYWEINGVSLQTLGWNITSGGGDLMSPPPMRGEDIVIPYVPGAVLQPRIPDSRTISFSMWVQGSDSDGRVPASATMRAEFEKNLKMLRALFWNGGQPVTLTRRWKNYGAGAVVSASATAIFEGGFAPAMTGSQRATYSVDMRLPDPFFYGAEELLATFSGATSQTIPVTVKGDYESTSIRLEVDGARNNVRLTNTGEGIWVNLNQNLSVSDKAVLSVDAWTAFKNPTGTSVNVIRDVTYVGHTRWMSLTPGARNLSVTSTSGTGAVRVYYRPKYL